MPADVALVCMPFGPIFSPCIGLSLLRAELAEQHVSARVHYLSLRFAESIGQAFYRGIAERGRPALEDLSGEWLFSKALFGTGAAEDARYVEDLLDGYYSEALIARLLDARDRVDAFLDESLETLVRQHAPVVGFTSMFQQHVASLALARRLKEASPSTFVVFGGSNCEGAMGAETVRSFPFVDAAISGEADFVFPELVRRVLAGETVTGLPGVRARESVEQDFASGVFGNGPVVHEMDLLPVPDYGDYFEQFRASRFSRRWQPSVFVETARGCWWGERVQCTFCGLNGSTLTFRSKSPARALAEVRGLMRRYRGCEIKAVDNVVDRRYIDDVLPALATRRRKVGLFYETRSNLTKDQLRRFGAAHVAIQPGIESFSDPVLKLMRKGVTGLQNIQLLKWCKEFGIPVLWNFLWGFPGEPPKEYERLARLIPLLTHLPPPVSGDRIRLDRFSPNFRDAARLGFTGVQPIPAYRHVYPLPDSSLANLACYFSYGYAEPRDVDRYTRRLARELEKWRDAAPASDVLSVDAGERLLTIDMRPGARKPFHAIDGVTRVLYRECDTVRNVAQLARAAGGTTGPVTPAAVDRLLAPLIEQGLMLREGPRYLALAIALQEHKPTAATNRRFATIVRTFAEPHGDAWIVPMASVWPRAGSRADITRPGKVPRLDRARFSITTRDELVIEGPRAENKQERRFHGQETAEEEESR